MTAKPVFYDGSRENEKTAEADQQYKVVITDEMRKYISGNPYILGK